MLQEAVQDIQGLRGLCWGRTPAGHIHTMPAQQQRQHDGTGVRVQSWRGGILEIWTGSACRAPLLQRCANGCVEKVAVKCGKVGLTTIKLLPTPLAESGSLGFHLHTIT